MNCEDCGNPFANLNDVIEHKVRGECPFLAEEAITTSGSTIGHASYRERLLKAARTEPSIYSKYAHRKNPGIVDNAWNPLPRQKRKKYARS